MKKDLTKENIFEIADALQAQGVKPTQVRVRDSLGGGSFTTINQYLREWRESPKVATIEISELPAEIQAITNNFIAKIYLSAKEAEEVKAQELVEVKLASIKKQNENLTNQLEDFKDSVKLLETEAEEKNSNLRETTDLLEAKKTFIDEQAIALKVLESDLESSIRLLEDSNRAKKEADQLEHRPHKIQ